MAAAKAIPAILFGKDVLARYYLLRVMKTEATESKSNLAVHAPPRLRVMRVGETASAGCGILADVGRGGGGSCLYRLLLKGMSGQQVYFLTGAASGIGQHLADRLVAQGHHVFTTDINFEALNAHAQANHWPEDRVRLRRLDVRDAADWDSAIEEAVAAFGRIDVAMNIAGYMLAGWAHEASPDVVDRHLDINVKGVIFGTQAAARQMLKQNGGQIINIASLCSLAPIPGIAIYSASKYAVRAFSIATALELRPRNVYVTTINPDAVRTPLLDPQKGIEAAAIVFSSPKLLSVEDVARAILERAIPHKPLEVNIPFHRGWLAHLTNLFPQYSALIKSFLIKRGAAKQAEFFAQKTGKDGPLI